MVGMRGRESKSPFLKWLSQQLGIRKVEEEGILAKYLFLPNYDPRYFVLAIACFGFVVSVYDTFHLLKSPVLSEEMRGGRKVRTYKRVTPELERDSKLLFTVLSVEHNALLFAGVVTSNSLFLLPWLVSAGAVILTGTFSFLAQLLKRKESLVTCSDLVFSLIFLVKLWHVFWLYTALNRTMRSFSALIMSKAVNMFFVLTLAVIFTIPIINYMESLGNQRLQLSCFKDYFKSLANHRFVDEIARKMSPKLRLFIAAVIFVPVLVIILVED